MLTEFFCPWIRNYEEIIRLASDNIPMIHRMTDTSLNLPLMIFKIINERKPYESPRLMLLVKGIRMIVKKAGIPSSRSIKLIFWIFRNMYNPTITRAGAVAYPGTIWMIGAKKGAIKNSMPTRTEDKPVLAPAEIPEAD